MSCIQMINNCYDYKINQVPFISLWQHYEQVQFLYPAKKNRIKPVMSLVAQNWQKALQAGDQLLWIASSHRDGLKKMATISLWRSTSNGWVAQHLTSSAGPEYVRNILMGTQLHAIENQYRSGQNWFQPTNKYASRIFGSIEQSIGKKYAHVDNYGYFFLPRNKWLPDNPNISIVRCKKYNQTLVDFLLDTMGSVYIVTEEWDQEDIELSQLNELYQNYGLFRYRRVWMAFSKDCGDYPAGAIIAYRGPLGLNFSLMENRMDLILNPALKVKSCSAVSAKLIRKAIHAYLNDYELESIPVLLRKKSPGMLKQLDIEFIRMYNKSSWVNKGFEPWCHHIANFFSILNKKFVSTKRRMNLEQNR